MIVFKGMAERVGFEQVRQTFPIKNAKTARQCCFWKCFSRFSKLNFSIIDGKTKTQFLVHGGTPVPEKRTRKRAVVALRKFPPSNCRCLVLNASPNPTARSNYLAHVRCPMKTSRVTG